MTAASRILRTIAQVIVAVCAAVPAAVALLDISATTSAKIVGIAGAVVVLVTAAQNALEAKGLVPTLLGKRDTVSAADRLAELGLHDTTTPERTLT